MRRSAIDSRPRQIMALVVAFLVWMGEASVAAREAEKEKPKETAVPRQPSPKPRSSRSAPPVPVDPATAELSRALGAARKELEEVESEYAKETERLGAQVVELTRGTAALRDEQQELEAKLRRLDGEIESAERKLASATEARTKASESLDATRGELESQAASFRERFAGSLSAAEDPDLLQAAVDAKIDETLELEARLEKLLGIYLKALDQACTASVFPTRLQLAAQGGRIEKVDALRIGLLSGYYSQPAEDEVGFVLTDPEGKTGLKGESRGLTTAQRVKIARLVEEPEKGGVLPTDITGGSGLAAMQNTESLARWFETGGFAMWPLLAVAITAVLLILERALVLGIKSLGTRSKADKVIALVRSGRPEEAEVLCEEMGGAAGAVLHAAIAHRDQGRSVMEDAVQEALLHHAPVFQARLGFIALCAAVAPLLGLLGTVTGMIGTFKMVTLFGTSDPRFLAGGISEALITTEAGLFIAIPSLLMRGILGSVAEAALGRLESGALSVVIALVKGQKPRESIAEAVA